MSMQYIRDYYRVPAKRGGRVEFTGKAEPIMGTITGSNGAKLRIRLDGATVSLNYHPTWKLRYCDATTHQANTAAQSSIEGSAGE